MAKTKSSVQLPGQSRSIACKTKSCRRLFGHKGTHRGTLYASPTKSAPKADTVRPEVEKAIAEVEAILARLRREAKLPAKTESWVETLSFDQYEVLPEDGPKVVILPMAEYQRQVADTSNGKHRTARRARRSPDTTRRSSTVSQALGI
jgi:hypothetical protein